MVQQLGFPRSPAVLKKIMEIDEHIGCAMSGLIADAHTLVEHARVETQNHRFSYGEPMTVESTTQALCNLALRFGEGDEESMSRPFGVSLLIAGHDEHGQSLYYTDPSGTFWQCNAKAIGSGSEGADSSLQEQYNSDLSLQEAEICFSPLQREGEDYINLITAVAKSFISLQHYESALKCYLLLEENFPGRVDNGIIHLQRAHCYSALNNGVAAGINMPARAAIVASLSKRTDGGRVQLRTNELLQMAGRAGRRGIDERGHVVFVQTPTEGREECCKFLFSGIEPLVSPFTASYGMVLNLLADAKVTRRLNKANDFKVSRTGRTLEDAKKLVEQSFGNYLGSYDKCRR
ncbi:hypothetical protein Nepgr_013371 [Nepenthes gracilis]|uniref:Uncharacterized protein n=1 Tax=Nepenthes gracilis TaxID=150966 RepID=A0AAD3SIR0_NEPGR|nr:hypothetical protein Nepgr_013371 [Nepenthes gracilis]